MKQKDPYTEKDEIEFLAWLRTLKSCVSGRRYGIQACHVRRVAYGSGTARKPRLFAVPMTAQEHHIQTVNGEWACLTTYLPIFYWPKEGFTLLTAKEWFENQALKHRATFLSLKVA